MVNGVIRIGKMKIEYFCFRLAEMKKTHSHVENARSKTRDRDGVGFGLVLYEKKEEDKMGCDSIYFRLDFRFG